MPSRLLTALFRPIDCAWLVAFRIGAGTLLALEMAGSLALGYYREYTQPKFHFSYLWFDWLPQWPSAVGLGLHFGAVATGIAVAVGWRYRLNAFLLTVCYTLLFLAEQTRYINHLYLYCLIAAWLWLLPAHRACSVDVRQGRVSPAFTVPAWVRYVFIFQLSLVYFYAGIAKLNPDWLLARPLSVWMAPKAVYPVLGPVLGHWLTPWVMSYAGLAFDLLAAPLLLWSRTRRWMFAAAVLFHLSNVIIFGLGTFPWFSLMMTACIYFPPYWPRQVRGLRRWLSPRLPVAAVRRLNTLTSVPRHAGLLLAGLGLYATVQLLVPLRAFLYPGDVHWTEEGHHFAWHMMLRSKSGYISFRVVLPNGRTEVVAPGTYLTPRQCNKLAAQPDLVLQFAHFLAKEYHRRGLGQVQVYADSYLQLNRRPPQPLVAPTTDLAAQPRTWAPSPWIMPAPPLDE
ncbi:HTTM domain-containing protein [Hymenobacter taeanensis]|uniref:HTTM domain-containing protein n=1 Tax=Hymenobacter taeanensis TaxID=2735321 RepID=A0A6M6BCS4_9BACT|nr:MULTISPECIES: HTTM domain-containing protein [Hymenobacter]QJX46017.1 HTTM domain-containing protein [Hymenobacter taeanensis]UOQ79870.1 HTTM domain-containing protein [Hymenobacter sp. 5414T-23]